MKPLPDLPVRVRDDALDGLRGVAIALVLWHHIAEPFLPVGRDSWLGWLRAGTGLSWCGVDLFFVLSGYFIGGILIDRRESPKLARVFYLRRAVRILPLYYLSLLAAFAVIAAGTADAYHRFPGWIYATFLTNFALAFALDWDWLPLSLLWSIAVEEQFYLIAPWVVRSVLPARLPWLAVTAVLLAWIARWGLLAFFPNGHFGAHVLMPLRMDGLALGVLIAWAVRAPTARPFFAWLAAHWKSLGTLGAVALGALALLRPADGSPVLCLFGYALIALVFALIVAIVAGVRPTGLNRLLSARPLTHLGRHSYFVYLWHALIGLWVVRKLGGSNFVLNNVAGAAIVIAAILVTWIAAAVSWKFFEGPLVAWGHRHSY